MYYIALDHILWGVHNFATQPHPWVHIPTGSLPQDDTDEFSSTSEGLLCTNARSEQMAFHLPQSKADRSADPPSRVRRIPGLWSWKF